MRSRTNSTSRSIATVAYADFWRGAGVDRARLAQALPQLPDTADELNAVARDVGATDADIHLGRDASETTLKRAALAQYGIIYLPPTASLPATSRDWVSPRLRSPISRRSSTTAF